MKRLLPVFAVVLFLAGCQVEPTTAPGTVLSVEETRQALPEELLQFDDGLVQLLPPARSMRFFAADGSRGPVERKAS